MTIVEVGAQPSLARWPGRLTIPEITPLLETSGSIDLVHAEIRPYEMIAVMDEAGVDRLLPSAWQRPGGWSCRAAPLCGAAVARHRGLVRS